MAKLPTEVRKYWLQVFWGISMILATKIITSNAVFDNIGSKENVKGKILPSIFIFPHRKY